MVLSKSLKIIQSTSIQKKIGKYCVPEIQSILQTHLEMRECGLKILRYTWVLSKACTQYSPICNSFKINSSAWSSQRWAPFRSLLSAGGAGSPRQTVQSWIYQCQNSVILLWAREILLLSYNSGGTFWLQRCRYVGVCCYVKHPCLTSSAFRYWFSVGSVPSVQALVPVWEEARTCPVLDTASSASSNNLTSGHILVQNDIFSPV